MQVYQPSCGSLRAKGASNIVVDGSGEKLCGDEPLGLSLSTSRSARLKCSLFQPLDSLSSTHSSPFSRIEYG